MSFLKILTNPDIVRFLTEIEKMENPEFKIGKFIIEGKTWIGIMIREKDKEEKCPST